MNAKIKVKSARGLEIIDKALTMLKKQFNPDNYDVLLYHTRNRIPYIVIRKYENGVQTFYQELSGRSIIDNAVGFG